MAARCARTLSGYSRTLSTQPPVEMTRIARHDTRSRQRNDEPDQRREHTPCPTGPERDCCKTEHLTPSDCPTLRSTSQRFVPSPDQCLVVLPTDVVNAADRGLVSDRAVWSPVVVVVEPVWQGLVALSM